VWFGSRMTFVSWWRPFGEPSRADGGVRLSWSTMKAPSTLIRTEPGLAMVLSISAVEVSVLGRRKLGGGVAGAASSSGPS
jgi:hypothetical protein